MKTSKKKVMKFWTPWGNQVLMRLVWCHQSRLVWNNLSRVVWCNQSRLERINHLIMNLVRMAKLSKSNPGQQNGGKLARG